MTYSKTLKVGDRVKYMGGATYGELPEVGTEGVVTEVVEGERVRVSFPGWTDGWSGDGEGVRNCWNWWDEHLGAVYEGCLKRVTPKSYTPGARAILKHLKSRGSISPVEAFASYGTLRLAPRIHELRQAGHFIDTTVHRDEAGHSYARYSLSASSVSCANQKV